MTCPRPESLSRWTDGTLDPRDARRVEAHLASCASCRDKAQKLRAVGQWLRAAVEPGPECLSESEMAALLEGKVDSEHVEGCPRCAAEFATLKSSRKSGTRRLRRRKVQYAGWAAAAAIFMAAGVLWLVLQPKPGPAPDVAKAPERIVPPAPPVGVPLPLPDPKPPVRKVEEPRRLAVPAPPPPPPPVEETPPPAAPDLEPVLPPPDPGPRRTEVEPARKAVVLQVRTGGLSAVADGKWVKATRVDEGIVLRADGRTSLEFASARLTFDASSRFSFNGEELSLTDGGVSAEVPAGSKFTLALDDQKILPQVAAGRVLMVARPDRIVVEEGCAKAGSAYLAEGVENHLRKGKFEAQKRRSLPAAARPRETVTWRAEFSNPAVLRTRIGQGMVVNTSAEGRAIHSGPPADPNFCGAQLGYVGQDERGFVTVKSGTALRFRYFLLEPASLELVMGNLTKQENFNKVLDPVAGQWVTVTLFLRDIPANTGGKKVVCEIGDRYRTVGWFIGKPGTSPQMLVDQLEIVDIEGR